MSKLEQREFQQRMGRIEALIGEIEGVNDPTLQANMQELVQALLDLHGAGLERMLDRVYQLGGQEMIDEVAQDDLVGNLLILHELHPLDLESRVWQALEKVRPALGLHGGNVELLDVSETGVVRLRLEGNCHGCASSTLTLKYTIEESIYAAAPDVTAIEVEGVTEKQPARLSNFVPMAELLGM